MGQFVTKIKQIFIFDPIDWPLVGVKWQIGVTSFICHKAKDILDWK